MNSKSAEVERVCNCQIHILYYISLTDLCAVRILLYLVQQTTLSTEIRKAKSKFGKTHNLQYDFVYS